MSKLSQPLRLSLIGAGIAVGLVGVLAAYFRRRRRKQPRRIDRKAWRRPVTVGSRGDADLMNTQSHSPKSNHSRHASESSEDATDGTNLSTVTMLATRNIDDMTAEQLCELGLEELQSAIVHWEEALHRLDIVISQDCGTVARLQEQLQTLVSQAYRIQDHYEEQLFTDVQTSVAIDIALQQMDRDYDQQRRHRRDTSLDQESSDQDSFVSALEVADLSDLSQQQSMFTHLVLYETALEELKNGLVHCRTLRTKMFNCVSDTEFLAKLHCVRLAFNNLLENQEIQNWFVTTGRQMLSDLLIRADRDPEDFQIAFDNMIDFVSIEGNWSSIEEELRGRGVKEMNFFDIVLDFVLFDAFDDLENPPSSVSAVVQNRWLSNGFKETALSTAVWSVLKAKKRLLKFPKGFIAHFYAISENISPLLAWGFLGPDEDLNSLCHFFRDCILEFIRDVFNFEKVAYTSVEQLSKDILTIAQEKMLLSLSHLAPDR